MQYDRWQASRKVPTQTRVERVVHHPAITIAAIWLFALLVLIAVLEAALGIFDTPLNFSSLLH
jgi:hypothetical protein